MLVAFLPVLTMVFIAVKVTSPGPFLYSQRRRGLHGRPFNILKIRTMTVGSDSDPKAGLGIRKGDTRITRVGGILRDLKIDELPQLWNIIRGEMEFVGPRAIADSLHEKLSRDIPRFPIRYCVRPGLTNLGQISIFDNAAQENVVEDWRMRFEAEWEFIRHKSVSLDILTGLMTLIFLIRKAMRPLFGTMLA